MLFLFCKKSFIKVIDKVSVSMYTYNSVNVVHARYRNRLNVRYRPKPPEARSKDLAFFVLPSVYKGLRIFTTYNCIVLDTN